MSDVAPAMALVATAAPMATIAPVVPGAEPAERDAAPAEPLTAEVAPVPATARLFIGGLVPGIGSDALLRALGRFGAVSGLERDEGGGYAHVTVRVEDSRDVDRCVAALHHTRWCGTLLRVERARVHYMDRLRAEWAEEREGGQRAGDADVGEEDAGVGVEGGARVAVVKRAPFAKFKKGAHVRFAFPDGKDNVDVDDMLVSDELEDVGQRAVAQGSDNYAAEAEVAPARQSSKSNALASTMQLFGLSDRRQIGVPSVPPMMTPAPLPEPVTPELVQKIVEAPAAKRLKRPRASAEELTAVQAVEKDPALINLAAEHQSALGVLAGLFPGLVAPTAPGGAEEHRRALIARCRKAGLFRGLITVESAPKQRPSKKTQQRIALQKETRKKAAQAATTAAESARLQREQTRPQKDLSVVARPARRAGLYRKLLEERHVPVG